MQHIHNYIIIIICCLSNNMISLQIKEDTKKLSDRLQCLKYLATHTVEVGLTSTASGRSLTLLAIHEHGSPVMHIPARPVVKPALAQASVKAEMSSAMRKACASALDGDLDGVTAALEESGQAGVDGIHAYIDAGNPSASSKVVAPHCGANSLSLDLTSDEDFRHWRSSEVRPPNAPVTLTGGWIRNPVSGKPVKVKGKSGTTPLVDTGQLYDDFDWEITKRER